MSPKSRSINDPESPSIDSMSDQDRSHIIVALDYPNQSAAIDMAKQLDPALCRLKVGKELFTSVGPAVIESLHGLGFQIFLDLKFHDIPNTVAKAVKSAAELGVWMVNVHVSGGVRMMSEARNVLAHYKTPPLLIGVTVLTSLEQTDLLEVGIESEPQDWALKLATVASSSGLDGVVCSAREVALIKREVGSEFLTVTPGIRLPNKQTKGEASLTTASDDQRRIVTPIDAVLAGSDYLVVGRPITQAELPGQVLRKIVDECNKAHITSRAQ